MIMASHQTFSGHLKHLTGQTNFGQSNILYITNGKVTKFLIEKPMSGQFSILIISTGTRLHTLLDRALSQSNGMVAPVAV